jgi:lipopolysaccharide transport system permease protein
VQELVIEAGRSGRRYWADLWQYRELFYFLAWRDLLVRYKQTVVGVSWALIRPLMTMAVLTVVFGTFAKLPSDVPYPLLVFSGVLPWQFFSTAVSDCGNSLLTNASLLSKVYFPRMAVPASSIITGLVDLMLSLGLLAIVMLWYHFWPGPRILLLPAFVLLVTAAAFGIGLWIAALMVTYRDFRFIVPFIVQFGLYISPVGFSSAVVPEEWRLLYSLNPMVAVIDGFRWALLGEAGPFYWSGFLLSTMTIVLLLVTGIRHFRAVERSFADVI